MAVAGGLIVRGGRPNLSRRAAIIGGLSLLGLARCSPLSGGYRYKLFVEIEVGGRRYSGSGIREIVREDVWAWPDQSTLRQTTVHGKAFWIEVGALPSLFVLLRAHGDGLSSIWDPSMYLEGAGKRVSLLPNQLPGLVYFDDIDRKTSAVLVKPNELSERYGYGARISAAWVEKTWRLKTSGISKKLPWIRALRYDILNNQTISESPDVYSFNLPDYWA
ncbi:hypothetical protein [uncultured Caulobacter sp.]|uniref:hypothetical protein n=1 Tax=uncultured Caulobacter sp. TaxID=158749 RepID=UPI002603AAE4|nr:hypothetical protein [uncultured Caulobacter sp.]